MSKGEEILETDITETMRGAYLDYAMSVIIGRALPDVRDGLKPVHRRILFAMDKMNLSSAKPFAKSSRVVGDVIGKYHPHGDIAVYDALVRMAQPFSMRYPLIDGQGNFGSVDGDSAAAMRYTEIRLRKLTGWLLEDINKNTIDFRQNYDNSTEEPVVLPTRIPTLLMNGSSGIAVGMATNIPPHNLAELISATIYLIENKNDVSFEKLIKIIPAPDFPTGGTILNYSGVIEAYKTGRGVIKIRGKADFELVNKRNAIIITELPYAVNKAKLVEKIASLVTEKKLEEIYDIRDESDRVGMRVVIELKNAAIADAVLQKLYSMTQLQVSFGINMLAVVNKQPQVLNLVGLLQNFIDHRFEVVIRRTRFDLRKAEDRAHIVEGLIKALAEIDEIVLLIKASADANAARVSLMKRFKFSEAQTNAILEMRLQRLTGLEQEKLAAELAELKITIANFLEILSNNDVLTNVIKEELLEIKKDFTDARLTTISADDGDIDFESMIEPEIFVLSLSANGYIKKTSMDEFRTQHRGGKGRIGMTTRDEDAVVQVLAASSHDEVMLFSSLGKVFWKKVHQIPESGRATKGRAIVNFIELAEGEKIVSWLNLSKEEKSENAHDLVMITAKGTVKRSPFKEFLSKRVGGIQSIKLVEGDRVVSVCLAKTEDTVFIATQNGMAVKFLLENLRSQGRNTQGVRGIRLKKADLVVSMLLVSSDDAVLTVSKNGYAKKSKIADYRTIGRGGMGVINMKVNKKTGDVIDAMICREEDQVLIFTSSGISIRILASQIPILGRATQGVKLINLETNDYVSAVNLVDFDALEQLAAQKSSGRLDGTNNSAATGHNYGDSSSDELENDDDNTDEPSSDDDYSDDPSDEAN